MARLTAKPTALDRDPAAEPGGRIYVGYTLRTASGQIYVGRTSGFGTPEEVMAERFGRHHQREYDEYWDGKWVGPPKIEVVVHDKDTIVGWEELNIQRAGHPFRYGGSSANARSEIDHSDTKLGKDGLTRYERCTQMARRNLGESLWIDTSAPRRPTGREAPEEAAIGRGDGEPERQR